MAIHKGKIRQLNSGGTYDYLLPETTIDMVNGLQDELDSKVGEVELEEVDNRLTQQLEQISEPATTSKAGIVMLYNDLNSSNATKAATANTAYQLKRIADRRDYVEYGEFKLPSDFLPSLPFAFYRYLDGKMKHTYNLDQFKNGSKHLYVNTTTGSDSANGESATPVLTLKQALVLANSSVETNIVVHVKGNLIGRQLVQADSVRTTITNKRISIIPDDSQEKIITTNSTNPTATVWIAEDNVYKSSDVSIWNVIDLKNRDWRGVAKPLTPMSSVVLCKATPNSYYTDNVNVWVNTYDGRMPDESIIKLKSVPAFRFNLVNSILYIKGLEIYTGESTTQGGNYSAALYGACDISGDIDSTFIHHECIFSGGAMGGTSSGLWQDIPSCNGLTLNNVGKTYGFGSTCAYVIRDGFNYHYSNIPQYQRKSCLVVEYECVGYECGKNSTNPNYNFNNNNATTTHEGVSAIRVGCIGYDTLGPVLADVTAPYTICIDCHMRDSKVDASSLSSVSYLFSANNNTGGNALLYNCDGGGQGMWGLYAEDGFPVGIRNFRGRKVRPNINLSFI